MKLDTDPIDNGQFKSVPLLCDLLPSVAQKLCKNTRDEQREVHEEPINLRPSDTLNPPIGKDNAADKQKKHDTDKSDRKLDQKLREQLAAKLNRDASIIQPVTVKGLKFARNERRKIIAAISLAEGSFVSVNKDSEFHMSPKRAEELHVTYYGVVHIGLSWGLIQFTQDSGELGSLLTFMRSENQAKFDAIFGDNSEELVNVTTLPGESGQSMFNEAGRRGQEELRSTGKEKRSTRVQPIAVCRGGEKRDLWQEPWLGRFRQAGLDEEFQEIQLLHAVNRYIDENNPRAKKSAQNIIPFLRHSQVQTALGIALLVDRSIQDGPGRAVGRIRRLANDAGITLPFTGPAQERKLAEYIVEKGNTTKDHKRRVKLLLEDKYRLLTVNLYDWETYGVEYDV